VALQSLSLRPLAEGAVGPPPLRVAGAAKYPSALISQTTSACLLILFRNKKIGRITSTFLV